MFLCSFPESEVLNNKLEQEIIVSFLEKSQTFQLRAWEEKRNTQENKKFKSLTWFLTVWRWSCLNTRLIKQNCLILFGALHFPPSGNVCCFYCRSLHCKMVLCSLVSFWETNSLMPFRKLFFHTVFGANQKVQTCSDLIRKTRNNCSCKYVGEKQTVPFWCMRI